MFKIVQHGDSGISVKLLKKEKMPTQERLESEQSRVGPPAGASGPTGPHSVTKKLRPRGSRRGSQSHGDRQRRNLAWKACLLTPGVLLFPSSWRTSLRRGQTGGYLNLEKSGEERRQRDVMLRTRGLGDFSRGAPQTKPEAPSTCREGFWAVRVGEGRG